MKKRLTRAEKRERTYEELILAAEKLFIEQGFHATSVDEIALKAGYTKGAVYSNIESKEDLFFVVYERRADRAVEEAERVIGESGPAAGLERLTRPDVVDAALGAQMIHFVLDVTLRDEAAREERMSR